MRDASTYRGARRNAYRGSTWGGPGCYYGELPVLKRRSYVSKNPSKYMPHDGGGQYKGSKKRSVRVYDSMVPTSFATLLGGMRLGKRA